MNAPVLLTGSHHRAGETVGRGLIMQMKVQITNTSERTIDLEVDAPDEEKAVAIALWLAFDIQPADWDYTWNPIHEEGHVIFK